MAAGLRAKSLAAKFKQGGAPGTYRVKWLLVEAAGTATENGLARNRGILLLRAIVGEPLHMEWTMDGQILTVVTDRGYVGNFLMSIPVLGGSSGSRLAFLTSFKHVNVVDVKVSS